MGSPLRVLMSSDPLVTANTPAQTTQGTDAAVILAANPKRKGVVIQNTGTTIIRLALGSTLPTQTVYHVALPGCTVADDATGGIYSDDAWIGAISAVSSEAGGTLVIMELQTGSPDWNQALEWGVS